MQAKFFGGSGHIAAGPLDVLLDVFNLELLGRVGQRGA